ncbi:hypothetical protein Ahy_A04g017624 isoform B [Arachis hypogaea]|uniref:Uncharacterized protein n=1 Tax=Arachis hypogaea TaxID=3818 RepID=A0A445DBL5_ARAHY|nr:hypothetical protein Ahy_A04g017624 isoform B [Arachis hypogaea]
MENLSRHLSCPQKGRESAQKPCFQPKKEDEEAKTIFVLNGLKGIIRSLRIENWKQPLKEEGRCRGRGWKEIGGMKQKEESFSDIIKGNFFPS